MMDDVVTVLNRISEPPDGEEAYAKWLEMNDALHFLGIVRCSRRAETDLLAIGAYTLRTWGEDPAVRYIAGLSGCCQMLADHPELGPILVT